VKYGTFVILRRGMELEMDDKRGLGGMGQVLGDMEQDGMELAWDDMVLVWEVDGMELALVRDMELVLGDMELVLDDMVHSGLLLRT
jgi:hypothetical protein